MIFLNLFDHLERSSLFFFSTSSAFILGMENKDLLRAAAQFTKTASTFGQMNGGSIPPSGPSGDPLSFLPVLSGNEYHYDHGNNMMDDGAGPKKISVSPTMTL